MSRNQRIGLIVGALVVAVVAFVIASPGGDDESSDQAAQTTQATTQPESGGEGETTPAETTYVLLSGEPLDLSHHGERITVTVDEPVTRPIARLREPQTPSQPPGREPIRRHAAPDLLATTGRRRLQATAAP